MFQMKIIKGNERIGNQKGRLGEEIACKFLLGKGFRIIARNYRKKWGEIDIIAEKVNDLHFIEVKSVSREIRDQSVTHETDKYRAEDNVHRQKMKRLIRTIQSYILENKVSDETDWQFDVVAVHIDEEDKKAIVSIISDLVI